MCRGLGSTVTSGKVDRPALQLRVLMAMFIFSQSPEKVAQDCASLF